MTAQSYGTVREAPEGRQPPLAERYFAPLDTASASGSPEWGTPASPAAEGEAAGSQGPQDGGAEGDGGAGFAALCFDASPGSVTRTRSFLRSTLTRWRLPELVDDATAIAAELVANAVTHGLRPAPPVRAYAGLPAGSARVKAASAWIALVRMEHAVVCAVADPSPELPELTEPAEADLFAESGRGLRIVAELSETWGHMSPEPAAGKTVWARLTCHPR